MIRTTVRKIIIINKNTIAVNITKRYTSARSGIQIHYERPYTVNNKYLILFLRQRIMYYYYSITFDAISTDIILLF